MTNIFKKTYGFICKAEEIIAMFCLLASTLVLCTGAITRRFGHPLAMISEISLCFFAWCVYLGADVAYRKGKLVYVEVIIDKVNPKVQRVIYAFIYVIIAIFQIVFVVYSIKLVRHSWIRGWASIPKLSYGWIALSIPVGMSLMFISTCIQFYNYVILGKKKKSDLDELTEDNINTKSDF